MLFRKMLREIRGNFGQFFSLFILSTLAVALFVTLKCNYLGASQALKPFHEAANLADGWLYGENFTKENLEVVRSLEKVNGAQLRMVVTGSAPEQGSAETDIILEDENTVNKPYLLEGVGFDPADTEGVWLNERFADAWGLKVGDPLALAYNGVSFTKTIRGLIASPEYAYMCASSDLEVDYRNIAYVYMAYRGFPAREYVLQLIDSGEIAVEDVLENFTALNKLLEKFSRFGITAEAITPEMLSAFVEQLDEEQLFALMPYTQLVITTDEEEVLSLEEELAAALENNYAAFVDQTSIPGIQNFTAELEQHRQFSYAFSVIFVLIAVLVIMTTMSRMVDKQRTQIGTMNAMGLKRWKITVHYLSYSFCISLAGAAAGLLLGMFGLGGWLVNLFHQYYTVPNWKAGYDFTYAAVMLAVVAACSGTAYFSCRRLLKVNPAESLRPAPPKSGRHCIFERLPFWDRLGFSTRYNLRDMSRSKLRAFMGVFGTGRGMMLMACGLGCVDTLDNIMEWSFEKLQNYRYEMVLDESMKASDADALAETYDGELLMTAGVEIAAGPHAVAGEKSTCTLLVSEGKGYFGITDARQQVVSLVPGTVALTMKLAKKLGLSVGDTVYWHIYEKNDWYEAKIGLINRNPNITGITMLREDFEQTGSEYHPSSLYTNADVSGFTGEQVTAIHSNAALKEAYRETMQVMYLMVFLMAGFSVVMVVVVLYNSGNLSFNERIKEFATLKVMGFRSQQIRALLSRQNLWLSAAGLILGAPLGRQIMQYMFDTNGDSYDYQAVINLPTYVISGILVLAISVLVSFMFAKRIKRLDMVDVLKGME